MRIPQMSGRPLIAGALLLLFVGCTTESAPISDVQLPQVNQTPVAAPQQNDQTLRVTIIDGHFASSRVQLSIRTSREGEGRPAFRVSPGRRQMSLLVSANVLIDGAKLHRNRLFLLGQPKPIDDGIGWRRFHTHGLTYRHGATALERSVTACEELHPACSATLPLHRVSTDESKSHYHRARRWPESRS